MKWRSNLFLTLGLASPDTKGGTKEKGFVRFHDLVTQSILNRTYRRYNYMVGMSFKTEGLARRIHKRVSHHYTQAGFDSKPYKIRLTSIVNSFGLKAYAHRGVYRAKEMVVKALEEMVEKGVLAKYGMEPIHSKERKNKIDDYLFTLYPSENFIYEAIMANRRAKEIRQKGIAGQLNEPRHTPQGRRGSMTHVGDVMKQTRFGEDD